MVLVIRRKWCSPTKTAPGGKHSPAGAPSSEGVIDTLKVGGLDLAAGDVVSMLRGKAFVNAFIVAISPTERDTPRYQLVGELKREATLRWLDTGDEFSHTFRGFATMTWTVIGGPKLAAANADRTLVTNGKPGVYNWIGGTPPRKVRAA